MTKRSKKRPGESPLAECLRRDAAASRPTWDETLCRRIVGAVERERNAPPVPLPPENHGRRRTGRLWLRVAVAVAVAIAIVAAVHRRPTPVDERIDPVDVAVVPADEPSAEDHREAVRALCEVIADTTETPNSVQRKMESISIERQGVLMVGSARTAAGTLIDQLPWSILESSSRRKAETKDRKPST